MNKTTAVDKVDRLERKICAEFNTEWGKFYRKHRVRDVVNGKMNERMTEFMEQLTMERMELRRSENGILGETFTVYTYVLHLRTQLGGESVAFTCEHLDLDTCEYDEKWVLSTPQEEASITIQDIYEEFATLYGAPLKRIHPSLTEYDAAYIHEMFCDYGLIDRLEEHREEMVKYQDAVMVGQMKERLAHLPIQDIEVCSQSYTLIFTDGTKIFTEPKGIYFKTT